MALTLFVRFARLLQLGGQSRRCRREGFCVSMDTMKQEELIKPILESANEGRQIILPGADLPRRKGFSYFQADVLFAVDLRYAPISFVNRPLAKKNSGEGE